MIYWRSVCTYFIVICKRDKDRNRLYTLLHILQQLQQQQLHSDTKKRTKLKSGNNIITQNRIF